MTGNLSIEAQQRYSVRPGSAGHGSPGARRRGRARVRSRRPGFAQLTAHGYRATSVDIGEASDAWSSGEAGRMDRLLADHGVVDVHWNLEGRAVPLEQHFRRRSGRPRCTSTSATTRCGPSRRCAASSGPAATCTSPPPTRPYVMNRLRLLPRAQRGVAAGRLDSGAAPRPPRPRVHLRRGGRDLTYAGLRTVARYGRRFKHHQRAHGARRPAGQAGARPARHPPPDPRPHDHRGGHATITDRFGVAVGSRRRPCRIAPLDAA